jgi:hypothetical protein
MKSFAGHVLESKLTAATSNKKIGAVLSWICQNFFAKISNFSRDCVHSCQETRQLIVLRHES